MEKPGTSNVVQKTGERASATTTQRITPNLWFDDQGEEAAKLYVSIFPNSRVLEVARYTEAGAKASGRPRGSAMTVRFTLDGQEFLALNGGPVFKFSEAVSFVINCDTQPEVDTYWRKLTAGGGEEAIGGWLKDPYGVSWQVVPRILPRLLQDKDPKKGERVMAALLRMKKPDIAALERAAAGT
jgi:predicted 3-demethylubiquinone-9 3-methyltransferase (glyoxalase superfamily)